MKRKIQLSQKRVFMFAIMLIVILLSTMTIPTKEENLIAVDDIPYYEGKYNTVNNVANIIDKIKKEDILISPFNINSTLAGLYTLNSELEQYFKDNKENVSNNYLSKMTKYNKNIKKKSKKEEFYEKHVQKFYNKKYDRITLQSLSKIGNIEKRNIIDVLNIIQLAKESLTNKYITLDQLKKYKPRENDYNINNQALVDKINTIVWDYNLYIKKNYIINISSLYYDKKYKDFSANYLQEKYAINTQAVNTQNYKLINEYLYNTSNKQVNYIVDENDTQYESLIASSFVFNYKWDDIIASNKNTYEDFYINDNIVPVEMLNFTSTNYLENDMALGFIKDYEKSIYSFVGILPKHDTGLSSINLEELLNSRVDINVNISIPKFSLTDSNNILPITKLKTISLSSKDSSITLDKFYQKNTFSFKEAGTYDFESKMIVENNIATLASVDNIVFNHPFYFMIIDNENNSVLLAGKITNPSL